MPVNYNEALILDGDSLMVRGRLASVSDDYRRLLSYRKMYQQPIHELCFVDTRFIGLYPEEVSILVESMHTYELCMDRSSTILIT